MEKKKKLPPDGPRQYVTCTVSLLEHDGIVIHVLNFSNDPQTVRVKIYKNTGAGAQQVCDSNDTPVTPTWQWGLAYNVVEGESGEFWVQIELSSETLIPKVSFERFVDSRWLPVVNYKPGDFAVFDAQQRRIR